MALNQLGAGFILSGVDKVSGVIGRVTGGFRRMAKFVRGSATGMQAALQTALRGLVSFGGAKILGGLRNAAVQAGQFSTSIAEVTTLIDEALFPQERMRQVTMGLAEQFGGFPKDQAKALYQTISAGITDATKATELLTVANEFAVGGVTDVTTAVDALTNVVNAYSSTGAEARDVSDAFFVAIRAGKTTAEELAHSIGRIAPTASSMNIAFDDLLGSIAAITTQGVATREAVSGLRQALANIIKPSADAKKEAKRLGIEFNSAALRSKGLNQFIQDITKSSKFADDSFEKLFTSVEGLGAIMALTSNNSKKYNEILDQMQGRVGSTTQAFDKMSETLEFQEKRFAALRHNITLLIGDAGERLLTPIFGMLNRITEGVLRVFESIPPEGREILVGVASGIGALVALSGGVLLLTGAMNMMGLSFGGIIMTLGKFLLVGGPAAILLSGIGVASFAAFKAFQKNTGMLGDSWEDMVRKIKIGTQAAIQIVSGGLSEDMVKMLNRTENQGLIPFLNRFEHFVERIKSFWGGLVTGFEAGVDSLAPKIEELKDKFGGIFDIFTGTAAANSQQELDDWATKGEFAGKQLGELGGIALDTIGKLIDFGKEGAEALSQITAEDIRMGIASLKDDFVTIGGVIKDIANGIRTIAGFISTVKAGAEDIGEHFGRMESRERLRKMGFTSENMPTVVDRSVLAARARATRASRAGAVMTSGIRASGEETAKRLAFLSAGAGASGEDIVREVKAMKDELKRLRERPTHVTVNMDGEKVADAVARSDAFTGADSLDEEGFVSPI